MPPAGASELATTAHHFTVDVEEYFQVSALEDVVPRDQWETFESRVEHSTILLLDMLDRHRARGTFFVLGWIAERHPELIRSITRRGHEVASHGWGHRRVTTLSRETFRDSIRRSKQLLEDVIGGEVLGYRAPSFSIVPGFEWALEILGEEGYAYDSSLFPIRRRGYGYPGAPRDPHTLNVNRKTVEFPPATLRLPGVRLPAAGGAYFRLLPYALTAAALRQSGSRGVPATFYIHPWELDPDQPRIGRSITTRVRHYSGLSRMTDRLERLFREFRFQPIIDTLKEMNSDRDPVVTHG